MIYSKQGGVLNFINLASILEVTTQCMEYIKLDSCKCNAKSYGVIDQLFFVLIDASDAKIMKLNKANGSIPALEINHWYSV